MKNLIHEVIFGRNGKVSGLIALAVVLSIALGCNCGKNLDLSNISKDSNSSSTNDSKPDTSGDTLPSNSAVEILVKDTISQFADAVNSGDFSDLHTNASRDFQSSYTVEEMKTAFKSYTNKKSLVMPIFRKVGATSVNFTSAPSIRTENGLKILMAAGKFPIKPNGVRFDFEYVWRDGKWKLLKLVVNVP